LVAVVSGQSKRREGLMSKQCEWSLAAVVGGWSKGQKLDVEAVSMGIDSGSQWTEAW